jgi:TldD protein
MMGDDRLPKRPSDVAVDRRTFLKLAGCTVAYHSLPRFAAAQSSPTAATSGTAAAGSALAGARTLAETCLATLKKLGAGYGDIRIGHYRSQTLAARDARLEAIEDAESLGFGVRVLDRGAWGFAASNRLTEEEVARVTREAVAVARASALALDQPVVLAPEPVHANARYVSPFRIDPFSVAVDDKIGLLLQVNEALKRNPGVKVAQSSMYFWRRDQLFASSEGSLIETLVIRSTASETASAVDEDDSQDRSYNIPALHAGYEHVLDGDLKGNAERVAAQAVEKLKAAELGEGQADLILNPEHLSLVIHESCGHASELDRALGYEANYAGTSFLTTDKLGGFRYGAPIVNLVADNVHPTGLASVGFDDDGVECQRWDIVREGVFVGYSDNREVAPRVGGTRSHGSCRADSWGSIPIVRIANVGLEPGGGKVEDLIADTRRGIYIEGHGSWSIDQRRWNMQFGGDAFWEIVNGKRERMLKNVIYQSVTPEFWGACDAVCSADEWESHGFLTCGKGQPGQSGHMTHGASPARFRKMKILASRKG